MQRLGAGDDWSFGCGRKRPWEPGMRPASQQPAHRTAALHPTPSNTRACDTKAYNDWAVVRLGAGWRGQLPGANGAAPSVTKPAGASPAQCSSNFSSFSKPTTQQCFQGNGGSNFTQSDRCVETMSPPPRHSSVVAQYTTHACSRAAVQPCSRAAVQPCSRAAVQPCSRAAVQPCRRA